MDNLTTLAIVAVALMVFYFLISSKKPDENAEHRLFFDSKELTNAVEKLTKKIDEMDCRVMRNEEKVKNLQLSESIEREQTKYLTANVNKTLYNL